MDVSYTQMGGVRYAYIERGKGPLLLFGHGTFGGKELFIEQIEELAEEFRCVAIDWPGHGQSGYDPAGWGVDDLVDDVPRLIGSLGHETAFLAGVSQGGAVFMRVALKYPDRVRGLVNMCGGPGKPPPEAISRMRAFALALSTESDEAARRDAVQTFIAASFHSPGFAQRHPEAVAVETDLILSHDRQALRLAVELPASYVTIVDQLPEIACPVLVIWGARDPRPQLGAEIAAAIPGAQLVVIDGAGHHVNVEAPHETAAAVRRFLRPLAQPTPASPPPAPARSDAC